MNRSTVDFFNLRNILANRSKILRLQQIHFLHLVFQLSFDLFKIIYFVIMFLSFNLYHRFQSQNLQYFVNYQYFVIFFIVYRCYFYLLH